MEKQNAPSCGQTGAINLPLMYSASPPSTLRRKKQARPSAPTTSIKGRHSLPWSGCDRDGKRPGRYENTLDYCSSLGYG
jgi:hypothetical protein